MRHPGRGQLIVLGVASVESVGVLQEDLVTTLEVDPVLECSHGQEEQCHVTHLTRYEPSLEQVRRWGW